MGASEIIALVSAIIALGAMAIAIIQARYARQAAREAKRQADAALGEVEPLIFLDSVSFKSAQSLGGQAALTVVNQNRRDVRLIQIEIKTDSAIAVSVDTGELRDAIAAAFQHSRKEEGAPLVVDLRDQHHVVKGSSIGTAGQRYRIPLNLTRAGTRSYTQDKVALSAILQYVLLDARHTQKQVEVFATVPFRP